MAALQPLAAPLFMATTAISAMSQAKAGRQQQAMYDAQAADALMKGRSEAIAYKQQGADVLRNLNENLAAIIARSSAGGVLPTSGSAATTALFGMAEGAREYHQAQDNAVMAEGQAASQAHQYRMAGRAAKETGQVNALSTVAQGVFMFGML